MKVYSNKSICLFVIIGLFLSPLYAYAKPRNRNFRGNTAWQENKDNRRAQIYKQLDLSPEQAEKLQALRNTHREKANQFRTDLKGKKGELKKELQKQELDMEKINQLHSDLKTILGQREDDRLKHILEVRKILTPEQLEKFLNINNNSQRKFKSKRGMRKK